MAEQKKPDDNARHTPQLVRGEDRMHPAANGFDANQEALDIQTLSRLEGLDRAYQQFPEDVLTAARVAFKVRASLQVSVDNTAEIWPVMQVKS